MTFAQTEPVHHDPDEVGAPPPVPQWGFFRPLLFFVMCGVIVAGAFAAGWVPRAQQAANLNKIAESRKNALPRVTLVIPRAMPAVTSITLPGDVQAKEEAVIYPRTNGYVKRWLVDIGAKVNAGDLLVEISTPEIDQQLAQAEAEVVRLKASLLTAEADLRFATATYQRYEALGPAAATRQDLDQRKAAQDTANAAIEAAKAAIKAGEANVQRIRELQAFSRIEAPFSGTITSRTVEIGQLVTSGNGPSQGLYRLSQTNPARVFVDVPQVYAPNIREDLSACVYVRENPNRIFPGKVTRTAGALDPATRTLRTQIEVPNDDGGLLTGSYVQVKLDVQRDNPPLLLPATALLFNAQGTHVAVVDETNHVQLKRVIVEGDFGPDIGVANGVQLTDKIVANPGDRLTEGLLVEVVQPAEKKKESGTAAQAAATADRKGS